MNPAFESIEKNPNFLYGDDEVIVTLAFDAMTPGQLQIFPREHFTIIEQVPNKILGTMFSIANKLSTVLFENLNCQGTNVVVNNGVPAGQTISRFSIAIIPRRENDGLNLQWAPKQLAEEQLSTVALQLTEQAKQIMLEEEQEIQPIQMDEPKQEILQDSSENLKLKQFRRVP